MYKISPTLLESFRVFKHEIYEVSTEDFIKQVKGIAKPTKFMSMGKLIHKFMETQGDFEYQLLADDAPVEAGENDLFYSEAHELSKIADHLAFGQNEVFLKWQTENIVFNMKVDKIYGQQIHEIKSGQRAKGSSDYDDSLQWRLYLLGSSCKQIIYHQITFTEKRPATIKYHEPFDFYAYNGMERDVLDYAKEFIDFCKHYNLESYITI